MSTLQDTTRHRVRARTRFGAGPFAIGTLLSIGLALLILVPTSGGRTVPRELTTGVSFQTHPTSAAVVNRPPTGCIRDPLTHALLCSDSAPVPFGIPTPPGYLRDPNTRQLLRVANTPDAAEHLRADQSHGRIVP
jgi:hypothetical protein